MVVVHAAITIARLRRRDLERAVEEHLDLGLGPGRRGCCGTRCRTAATSPAAAASRAPLEPLVAVVVVRARRPRVLEVLRRRRAPAARPCFAAAGAGRYSSTVSMIFRFCSLRMMVVPGKYSRCAHPATGADAQSDRHRRAIALGSDMSSARQHSACSSSSARIVPAQHPDCRTSAAGPAASSRCRAGGCASLASRLA